MAMKTAERRVTGHDVARAAGVSQATVSLVMSGKSNGRISEEQRDRVRRIARELGYQPNPAARSLRLGRTHAIALVVPNVANPFFASVLLGAERAARARGNAVMLLDTGGDPDWPTWLTEVLSTRAVDGCIFYAAGPFTRRHVRQLGVNLVLIEARAPRAASIELDIGGGARAAMEHLVGLGHRAIAHVRAHFAHDTFQARRRAYEEVMAQANLAVDPRWEVTSDFDIDSSTRAAGQLLDLEPRPTAILCDDDLLAAGVYKAASERGLRVGQDLSVVGFDDIELARILEPALTTVAIPAARIGAEAVTMAIDLAEGEKPRTLAMGLDLIVRSSTGPAPASA